MPLLYLVRHGETDWNREHRWQGHYDLGLSASGRAQASAAAARLRGERIAQIHSSDLRRALETAQVVAEACGLVVHADRALREVDVGSWAGLTREEAKKRFPEGYARRRAGGTGWDSGETYEQMGERVRAYVTGLVDAAAGSERIALVCHSGVIRLLVVHALGLVPADRRHIGGTEHGALSVLRVRRHRWSLCMYNDSCHLPRENESTTTRERARLSSRADA
jgi:broad specificity phosphatase PhoE